MDRPILLDHAASTPPRPEVVAAFLDAVDRSGGGNPSAGHAAGRAARTVLEEARERVAATLDRSPHEVVFTSGGTEADQLAVVGQYRAARAVGRSHLVCSEVEHPAVLDAVTHLEKHEGARVTWLTPGAPVPVRAEAVAATLDEDTGLVVVTAADGELGVRQLRGAADTAFAFGAVVHRDAVQAIATSPVPPLGSLALSGHKLGAPVGVGVLVLPRDAPIEPLLPGPGQERGLRSGTPAAALAAAMALAVELAVDEATEFADRARSHTGTLWDAIEGLDGVRPTVPPDAPYRLATHLHLTVDGVDGEALATALDAAGVHASGGTACATGTSRPSQALRASGVEADAALRLSVGRTTTREDVIEAARRIAAVVTELRAAGGGFL